MRWEELKKSKEVPPETSLEKYAMKLEMTPNLEESDIKKEQVLQAEDTFNLNNHQKLQSVKNLPLRWEELKKSKEVPPETSLEKYAMKLEMTPNLEESDIKKEQVLQAEDTFNLNNHQKLQSVKNLPLRWEELKKSKEVPPETSLEKYAMKLEMTPNLEESNVKKEQVLQAEDSFNPNNHQKLQTVENLLVRWEELKKSKEVPPETSLEKYVMKLEMTPNLEESDIKKEQVLQVEDNDQKLEMLQKEVEKVLEQAVPKIHQEN